jgi:cobalt/nickel transport system permease protein
MTSALSRRPAWLLMAAIAATIATVSVSSLGGLAALGGIVSTLLLCARARFGWLLRRLGSVAPIALIAGLLTATRVHGVEWNQLWTLRAPPAALNAGGLVVLRIVIATLFGAWLNVSLAPAELEAALSSLGVPHAVVELLALTRRFAGQLSATLASAWISVALRGGFVSRRRLGRTLGLIAGVVVVRALDRSQRVATALTLRGHGYSPDAALPAAADERQGALHVLILFASLVGARWLT